MRGDTMRTRKPGRLLALTIFVFVSIVFTRFDLPNFVRAQDCRGFIEGSWGTSARADIGQVRLGQAGEQRLGEQGWRLGAAATGGATRRFATLKLRKIIASFVPPRQDQDGCRAVRFRGSTRRGTTFESGGALPGSDRTSRLGRLMSVIGLRSFPPQSNPVPPSTTGTG